jgi:hypothetical protein
MSIDSAKRVVHKFWNAMILNPALNLALPRTLEELEGKASAFDGKCKASRLYKGVIGALNGWLCNTNKPIIHNTSNLFPVITNDFQVVMDCGVNWDITLLVVFCNKVCEKLLVGFTVCIQFIS